MKILLFFFVLLSVLPFVYGMNRSEFIDTIEGASCITGDCLNTQIVSDIENVADIYNVIDKFTGDMLNERKKTHVYYWEYLQLKNEGLNRDQFDLLYYEYKIMKNLGDCLNHELNTEYFHEDELFAMMDLPDEDFFYGDLTDSLKHDIATYYYQCLLQKGKSLAKLDKEFSTQCAEDAHFRYFSNEILYRLSEFGKMYGHSHVINIHAESFVQCHGNDVTKFWSCYKELNNKFHTFKQGYLINTLINQYGVTLEDTNKTKIYEDFADCLALGARTRVCREKVMSHVKKSIFDKVGADNKKLVEEKLLPSCMQNTGLTAEKDCLNDIILVMTSKDDPFPALYQRNLERINNNWQMAHFYESQTLDQKNSDFDQKTWDYLENYPEMTLTEADCINTYSRSGYWGINSNLWAGGMKSSNTSEVAGLTGCLNSALEKISQEQDAMSTDYRKDLFRGTGSGLPQELTERFYNLNDCITFTGMTSTSDVERSARSFLHKNGFLFYIKNCPAGDPNSAAGITNISHYENESEWLFKAGVNFIVTEAGKQVVDKNKGYYTEVHLECVPQDKVGHYQCH